MNFAEDAPGAFDAFETRLYQDYMQVITLSPSRSRKATSA